jgi:hypothetical protein
VSVDAIWNNVNSAGRNATSFEHVCNSLRNRDDRSRTTVLPASSDIVPEREVHASRDHEWHRGSQRRKGADGDRVRGVGVNDVDFAFSNGATQPESSGGIDLRPRAAVDHIERLLSGALSERLAFSGGHKRAVTAVRQFARKPERLPLTPSPAALRVDVKHSKVHAAQLPGVGRRTQAATCATVLEIAVR